MVIIGHEEGAETPIYLASSPAVEGVSGKYFIDKEWYTRVSTSMKMEVFIVCSATWRLWQASTDIRERPRYPTPEAT